jgi:hypothetical protein
MIQNYKEAINKALQELVKRELNNNPDSYHKILANKYCAVNMVNILKGNWSLQSETYTNLVKEDIFGIEESQYLQIDEWLDKQNDGVISLSDEIIVNAKHTRFCLNEAGIIKLTLVNRRTSDVFIFELFTKLLCNFDENEIEILEDIERKIRELNDIKCQNVTIERVERDTISYLLPRVGTLLKPSSLLLLKNRFVVNEMEQLQKERESLQQFNKYVEETLREEETL